MVTHMTVGTRHMQWTVAALLVDGPTDSVEQGRIRILSKGCNAASKIFQGANSCKIQKIIYLILRQESCCGERHTRV